jgi:hypothetical protein
MIPSIEHIIKKRHHNRRRLRFMALILAVIGVICVSWGVFSAILVDHTWSPSMPMVVFGCGFFVPVIPLWVLDERIGRALVPLSKHECPGCHYNLTALQRPICPECGLGLPTAYIDHSPGSQES